MDIQRADKRLRTIAAISVLVVAAIAALLLASYSDWLAAVRLLPPDEARRRLMPALAWAGSGGVAAVLVLAAWMWRYGIRVCRAARFPPAGARVLRDTVILLGPAALRRGRLLKVFGAALVLCALGQAGLLWRVYLFLNSAWNA